jgi:hypothetical protein
MALEGTHIKFAVDLKDRFSISDIHKYISGTIYPDSRYITKIERTRTHQKDFIDTFLKGDDDFKKGWAVHLICDRSQKHCFKEFFPEFYSTEESKQGNDVWISETAVKVLQDVDVVKQFSIMEYVPCLDYIETPNSEDEVLMRKYNTIFQVAYTGKTKDSLEARYETWRGLGIDDVLMYKIQKRVEEFRADESMMKRITSLYDSMLAASFIE